MWKWNVNKWNEYEEISEEAKKQCINNGWNIM